MKFSSFGFILICSLTLAGCLAADRSYHIEISQPTSEISFVGLDWYTALDWGRDPVAREKVIEMARRVVEAELKQRGLPCKTIYVGSLTSYEGSALTVNIFASAGNMSLEDLTAKTKQIIDADPLAKKGPKPSYSGRGEFQN